MNANRLWITLPALGLLSLTTLAGCSGSTYGEIEGRVTRGGVPLEHVQIVFYPEEDGPRSWAMTDKDGHFEVITDAFQKMPASKGAPVGKYRVALVDMHDEILEAEQMMQAEAARAGLLDPKQLRTPAPPMGKKKKASGSGVRVPAQYTRRLDTPFNDIEIKPGKNWFDLDVK